MLAKIGVDTAENEPLQVCPLSAYRSPRFTASDDFNASAGHKISYANASTDAIVVDVGADIAGKMVEQNADKTAKISEVSSKAQEAKTTLEDKLSVAQRSLTKRFGKTKTAAEDKSTDGTSDFPADFMGPTR